MNYLGTFLKSLVGKRGPTPVQSGEICLYALHSKNMVKGGKFSIISIQWEALSVRSNGGIRGRPCHHT